MTESEFLKIVCWSDLELYEQCKSINDNYGPETAISILMDLRKDLQKSLTNFSKKKTEIDGIQMRAVKICDTIYRWCGKFYKKWAMVKLIKNNPLLATRTQKLKGLTNNAWEVYAKKKSY